MKIKITERSKEELTRYPLSYRFIATSKSYSGLGDTILGAVKDLLINMELEMD